MTSKLVAWCSFIAKIGCLEYQLSAHDHCSAVAYVLQSNRTLRGNSALWTSNMCSVRRREQDLKIKKCRISEVVQITVPISTSRDGRNDLRWFKTRHRQWMTTPCRRGPAYQLTEAAARVCGCHAEMGDGICFWGALCQARLGTSFFGIEHLLDIPSLFFKDLFLPPFVTKDFAFWLAFVTAEPTHTHRSHPSFVILCF